MMMKATEQATRWTRNELNNLVFLGLKYTCHWKQPPNPVIERIVRDLEPCASVTEIFQGLTAAWIAHTGEHRTTMELKSRLRHYAKVVKDFQKQPPSLRNDLGADKGYFGGQFRIRCPKCEWQPTRDAQWRCLCGHVWNTFDTSGRCPGCDFQWRDTACLNCHQWSLHIDWYAPDEEADEDENRNGTAH